MYGKFLKIEHKINHTNKGAWLESHGGWDGSWEFFLHTMRERERERERDEFVAHCKGSLLVMDRS